MGKVQIYEPFKGGLPPVIPYFSDVWRRREFISAYSRSELRAQNFGSFFGQLWLILNPLILAFVYYLLITVIGGDTGSERFAHLTAGLFLFYFITNSMMAGSKSITSGGKLVLNSAFPRLILPISATVISFFKFLPTFILGFMHLILGLPIGPELFYLFPVLLASIIFALGTAIITSILNVYFRDTKNFLPYFTRAWLYLSPVLYTAEQLKPALKPISYLNPLYTFIGSWTDILIDGVTPTLANFVTMFSWAIALLLFALFMFMRREREFALRI
jgi:ABC-type polysaccharide/polyol phosphate export permease